MRDFHDQKDLFKAMHEIITDCSDKISWLDGHIYIIDTFLWFMARYGYTLQKTRTNIEFRDINEDIEMSKERKNKLFDDMLKNSTMKNKHT